MDTTASLLARYPNPRSVLGAPMLRGPEGGELYNQVPMLSGFVDGLVGTAPDELGHSVLDPKNEDAKTGARWGYGIGTALNVVPPLAAGLGMLKGSAAVPRLGSNQKGAIRIGGDPGFVLTHAISDQRAKRISHAGQFTGTEGALAAPSLGVTYKRGNDYKPYAPSILFSADEAQKITPTNYPGATHINRDGYFSNPLGKTWDSKLNFEVFDPAEHVREVQNAQAAAIADHGSPDLRLMQMWPPHGDGQALSIAASPNFRSMKAFEESAHGGGLLQDMEQGLHKGLRSDLRTQLTSLGIDKYGVKGLQRKLDTGIPLTPDEQGLVELARRVPSKMSELKVPQLLPISADKTAVYLPTEGVHDFKELTHMRDVGFRFTTRADMDDLAATHGLTGGDTAGKMIHKVAPPEGGIWMPPRSLNNESSFMDFLAETPAEFAHSPKYAGKKSYFDLGSLKVPTLADMKPVVSPKTKATPEVNLEGLFDDLDMSPETTSLIQSWGKGFDVPAPAMALGDNMTLGAPQSFAPAKKGWSKVPKIGEAPDAGTIDLTMPPKLPAAPANQPNPYVLEILKNANNDFDVPKYGKGNGGLAGDLMNPDGFNMSQKDADSLVDKWLNNLDLTFEKALKDHFFSGDKAPTYKGPTSAQLDEISNATNNQILNQVKGGSIQDYIEKTYNISQADADKIMAHWMGDTDVMLEDALKKHFFPPQPAKSPNIIEPKKKIPQAPGPVAYKQPAGAGPTMAQIKEMTKPGYKIPMTGQGSVHDVATHFNLDPAEATQHVNKYYNDTGTKMSFDDYMIHSILDLHGDNY